MISILLISRSTEKNSEQDNESLTAKPDMSWFVSGSSNGQDANASASSCEYILPNKTPPDSDEDDDSGDE